MGILSALLPIASTVLDRVIPDKNARANAKELFEKGMQDKEHEIDIIAAQTQQDVLKATGRINLAQARSKDPFVTRARPALLWVCVFSLTMMMVVMPLAAFITEYGVMWWGWSVPETGLPQYKADVEALYALAFPLLGLVGARSFDKSKGVASGQDSGEQR